MPTKKEAGTTPKEFIAKALKIAAVKAEFDAFASALLKSESLVANIDRAIFTDNSTRRCAMVPAVPKTAKPGVFYGMIGGISLAQDVSTGAYAVGAAIARVDARSRILGIRYAHRAGKSASFSREVSLKQLRSVARSEGLAERQGGGAYSRSGNAIFALHVLSTDAEAYRIHNGTVPPGLFSAANMAFLRLAGMATYVQAPDGTFTVLDVSCCCCCSWGCCCSATTGNSPLARDVSTILDSGEGDAQHSGSGALEGTLYSWLNNGIEPSPAPTV